MLNEKILSRRTALRWTTALLAALLLVVYGCASEETDQTYTAAPERDTMQAAPGMEAPEASVEEREAPNVTFATLDGETFTLEERRGEVLLINFWATWCAPCRKEIPDLVEMQEELGPRGFTVIGVSEDQEGAEVVDPFVEEFDINYPIVIDDGAIAEAFGGVMGLPTTFVVDAEGMIVDRKLGLFSVDEMRARLEEMLDEADAS